MNSLSEVATAIAGGAQELQLDVEFGIPLDEFRAVHVLRSSMRPDLVVSVSDRSVDRSQQEQEMRREALLRVAADTRWTHGLTGGLDAEGRERIFATLKPPLDATRVESLLTSLLARMGDGDTSGPSPDEMPAAGVPPTWLRA
jgi:hypothetical protein